MSDSRQKTHPAAGGWGSLASVAKHLAKSGSPVKGARSLLALNQKHGFDCPGCAWGDPEHASSFEFCENGVKAVAWEATDRTVGADFFAAHAVSWLRQQDHHFLEAQGRLAEPLRYDRASDRYVAVGWDEAFARIGAILRGLGSPDEAVFYTSGRTSNEAAFLYQLFVRAYGTNNLPDCSNMCHEASGIALTEQIGVGKGTVLLDDFKQADAIFVWGQNPGSNHPRMLADLRAAALRGARIVVFNPVRERGLERFAHPQKLRDMLPGGGVDIATDYYQLRVGGDMAAAKGIMKHLFERHRNRLDWSFIAEQCSGIDALEADIAATGWAEIERRSGLTREQLAVPADIYAEAERTIFTWAMGLTQHKHSVVTIQTLVDLLLLKGNVGKPGAGACPVRGHSNVQGDRTMGINEHPSPAFLDRLEAVFGLPMPRRSGHNTVSAIQAMLDGRAKAFIAMGGNFAAATPDTARTETALARCRLTVHVSTKLNRSHLVTGEEAYILPCLGRTEIDIQATGPQFVTVEDSMSMIHGSGGLNMPVSPQIRSEPAIIAGLARATLPDSPIDWDGFAADYNCIRDRIADVVPGFEDFNRRVGQPGGFYLGNSARERMWQTESGRAHFMANPLPEEIEATADGRRVFTLMSFRSHDQYNTTVYGYGDRYRGVTGDRRVLFMNPDDIAAEGLAAGDHVDLATVAADDVSRIAPRFRIVAYDIPAGNLATYFPEANILVPLASVGDRSGTPTSKEIPVTIGRSAAGG